MVRQCFDSNLSVSFCKKNGCCDDVFAFRFFRTLQIQKKAELFDDDDGVKFF